jgi:hypothetical protein
MDALGAQASTQNVCVGVDTMTTAHTGAASANTCIGYQAGTGIQSSDDNVFVGFQAGAALTTGNKNVCIGYETNVTTVNADYQIAIGTNISAASNDCVIGRSGTGNYITVNFDADADWDYSSDLRMKRNIQNNILGLSFINDLSTKTFQWKPPEEYPEEWENWTYKKDADGNNVGEKIYPEMNDNVMHGMIAQEVKTALDTAGVDTFAGWSENEKGVQSLGKVAFVIPLIKAVQELTAKVTALENA